jgi:transglutaminase-like putative cysteine protease
MKIARLFFSRSSSVKAASLQRDQGGWLLAAAAITLAPHLLTLPIWAAILCPVLLVWRGWRLWSGQMAPARWLLIPLALGAAIGTRFSFGHLLGKDSGLSLLAVLLALKLLEIRNQRDIRVTALLCFFLQIGAFLGNQSLPIAAIALIATLLTLGSLLALIDPGENARERLTTSALLLVHGLPFMLVLFVLFPRIGAPLWGLPADALSGTTGLSDSMSPGSISEVSMSDDPAFYVEFFSTVPPRPERYWRGPVLSTFDGRSWLLALRQQKDLPAYRPRGAHYDYQIMLEPHYQHWLPVLDFPAGPVANVRFSYDFQALARTRVSSQQRFRFTSYPEIRVGEEEDPNVLRQATFLPPQSNPRTRALAAELKGNTAEETLERTLAWLSQAKLIYTLQPPIMESNSIDLFLFDDKLGFCEHFSSAFVFLMRAANVPSRVVTGYQGGEINPYNDIMVVRQSDAHAWAEVWLEGRGWIRVDPTALVAPQRIDRGLAQAVRRDDLLPMMMRSEYSWLRSLRFRWEMLTTEWNRLVLSYDQNKQRDLLELFGFGDFRPSTLFGLLGGALAVLTIALFAWAQRTRFSQPPLDRAWENLSRKLARSGLARKLAEGPLDYGRRIAAALPAHAETLTRLCAAYARLCYRPPASKAAIRAFVHAVRDLGLKTNGSDTARRSPTPPR